jgi:hypothetical protein
MLQRGVVDDDNEWEPVEPITSPCVSGYWGLSGEKPSEIGYPVSLCAGGAQFSPHTSHMIRKRTVNATLATSHQADPAHCYKFHILQRICSTQYFTIFFLDWGRRQKPGSVPGDIVTATWDRRKHLNGSLPSSIHIGCLRDADVFPLHLRSTHHCWRHGFMAWRWCRTCTTSPPTPPQLRGGHLLHPVGLATVICQFLVLLGLRLVAMADSPGSNLPDIRFLSLCYVNVVHVLYGLNSRKAFNMPASSPQLTAVAGTDLQQHLPLDLRCRCRHCGAQQTSPFPMYFLFLHFLCACWWSFLLCFVGTEALGPDFQIFFFYSAWTTAQWDESLNRAGTRVITPLILGRFNWILKKYSLGQYGAYLVKVHT